MIEASLTPALATGHARGRAARDAVREERRRSHRVPGRRRRSARPRVRSSVDRQHGALLGGAFLRPLPHPTRLLFAPDPLRQARNRQLRSGGRDSLHRATDRRSHLGPRQRGVRACGPPRCLRGRIAVHAVRGHPPRAHDGAHPVRSLGDHSLEFRDAVGADPRNLRDLDTDGRAGMGQAARARVVRAERRTRAALSRVVGAAAAPGGRGHVAPYAR